MYLNLTESFFVPTSKQISFFCLPKLNQVFCVPNQVWVFVPKPDQPFFLKVLLFLTKA